MCKADLLAKGLMLVVTVTVVAVMALAAAGVVTVVQAVEKLVEAQVEVETSEAPLEVTSAEVSEVDSDGTTNH